jgi:hypothetical protein
LSTGKRPVPANAEPGTTDQTGAGPVPVIRDRRMRAFPAVKPLLSTRKSVGSVPKVTAGCKAKPLVPNVPSKSKLVGKMVVLIEPPSSAVALSITHSLAPENASPATVNMLLAMAIHRSFTPKPGKSAQLVLVPSASKA